MVEQRDKALDKAELQPEQHVLRIIEEIKRRGGRDLMKGKFRKSTVARMSTITGASGGDVLRFMQKEKNR